MSTGKLIWKSGDETITHAPKRFTEMHGSRPVIFFAQSGLASVNVDNGQELWRTSFPFSVSTPRTRRRSSTGKACKAQPATVWGQKS